MMNKKLNVQWFIEQHSDWEKLLSEKPYCLTITRDKVYGKNLLMLKYSQVDSDFNEPIVRECRGLILDEDTLEPVSIPFFKFGNVGESYCPDIDWKSASILQKVDGSLIKIVKIDGKLLISTNGTIDASKAPIAEQLNCPFKTFEDIVLYVFKYKDVDYMNFKEGFTYMFELVSPWTRVVVPWKENNLYFLGLRDNTTFEEQLPYGHPLTLKFDTPAKFNLHTLDECIAATKEMPWDEEGYVVVDKDFNRVKVKSPSYVAAHNLKGNGVMSYARAIELVRSNEIDEVCSYFEEFRSALEECKERFWSLVHETETSWNEYLKVDSELLTRKDKAIWITKNFKFPGAAFCLLDKKVASVKDFFMQIPAVKLLSYLNYKDI
jgi:hypothetical protein